MKNIKIGILGSGQLGKMLMQAANAWSLNCKLSGAEIDVNDFDAVLNFGRTCELLTVELENVNTDALSILEREGIKVHPSPNALKLIQDKYLQKKCFRENSIPTADYIYFDGKEQILHAIDTHSVTFPFVQKMTRGGYDGNGVKIIRNANELNNLLPGPSIIEPVIQIAKEVAIIVARNPSNQTTCYAPVEMCFLKEKNVLDYTIFPSDITPTMAEQMKNMAIQLAQALNICGVLAIEFFIDANGSLLVNEMAPRPHNSGHHTIEGSETSQFEQHLRGILNLPLGSVRMRGPVGMVNVLGNSGFVGTPLFDHLEHVLAKEGTHLHLYGKPLTKPFRKMGHITIMHKELNDIKNDILWIKNTLKVKSQL